MIEKGSLVLFQGDSITDTERGRDAAGPNDRVGLGRGYVFLIASRLRARAPRDDLRFLNRGISGNRIVDLYARWKEDGLNLKPDLISILVGVNDTWHEFMRQAGVTVPKFERMYRQLLTETREVLPGTKLVLCEPFTLPCGVVTPAWTQDMALRRAAVRRLAQEFAAPFVPFQAAFDEAVKEAPPEYWAQDGVHPTAAGHYRMACAWLKVVEGD
jgi:lysophospholipase L1-like esterase